MECSVRLIQAPESLHIICVELKQLADKSLRYLLRCQTHLVQSAEERQQVEPGGFEARTQVRGDFRQCAAIHSIEHGVPAVFRSTPRTDFPKSEENQAMETMRMRSNKAQLSFNNSRRNASRRRAPASLQRIPAWRRRACTTCLCALSTAPLPIP